MPKFDFSPAFAVALMSLALGACASEVPDTDGNTDGAAIAGQGTREFSAEDKRAAMALSVSRGGLSAQKGGPYERALQCSHGIEVLANRLGAAGLGEQQREGIERARAYFTQQLSEKGKNAGRKPDEIRSDLARTAEDILSDGDSLRIAISCLRKLQES